MNLAPDIVRIETPSSAINKTFFVQLGYRPMLILIFRLDDGGQNGIAVDGFTDAGEVGIIADDNTAWDDDASNGITIEDKGFKIGTSTSIFRRSSAELCFVCFPPPTSQRSRIFTLDNNLPLRDDEPYGDGDQYDIDTAGNTYNPEFSDFGVYRES